MSSINYDLKKIKAFVFDIDGVLSPNSVSISPNGEPLRMLNVKDGYAMNMALRHGYSMGIITGGNAVSLELLFSGWGIKDIYLKSKLKIKDFEDYILKTGYNADEIMYAGDDIPDYHVMQIAGLSVAPADAAPEIKNIAKYISHCKGGDGIARDVIEQVMRAQGNWMSEEAFCW